MPSVQAGLSRAQQALIRQIEAQVTQLEAGLVQARRQVAAMDQQIAAAQEAQKRGTEQADEAARLARAAQDAQSAQATPLRLSQVATVREVAAPATITRTDGVRTVTVSATPTGDDLSATNAALRDGIEAASLPSGVTATLGGVSADQEEAFRQLGLAMLIAIAIVFLVMVATFRSLIQPLILLVSIPFAATGAVALLLLTDTALGLPAMIGLLMLIGIVVTNAIVLIDLINQYRAAGDGIEDAIIDGARLRLRPIVMTAMATICALIPMALGLTGGGVFISRPLAIVVIGGLVTSTLLTLLLVPVLYDLVESGRQRMQQRRGRGGDDGQSDNGPGDDGRGGPSGGGDGDPSSPPHDPPGAPLEEGRSPWEPPRGPSPTTELPVR